MNENKFKYSGALALIELHEKYLTDFAVTWRLAKNQNLVLPKTDDPDYISLETLIFHVLRSARNYMIWICKKLNLPDPEIKMPPAIDLIEKEHQEYIDYLIVQWKEPLIDLEQVFYDKTFLSNWGVEYSIEAMLEHAVMHPIRHAHQLNRLMSTQK